MKHTSDENFDFSQELRENALLVTFHPPWGTDECTFSLHQGGAEGGVSVRMTATQLGNLCDRIEEAQQEMTEYFSKKAAVRG